MLEFLRGKSTDRKLRLFSIACVIAADIRYPGKKYLDAFDRHADGIETEEDKWLLGNDWTPAWESAYLSIGYTGNNGLDSRILRDIFGNTFIPLNIDYTWLTFIVQSLATAIYNDRAFDRLPILADVLQKAGCDNDAILTHCRSDGPHVRGCWVVDLVLGKS